MQQKGTLFPIYAFYLVVQFRNKRYNNTFSDAAGLVPILSWSSQYLVPQILLPFFHFNYNLSLSHAFSH